MMDDFDEYRFLELGSLHISFLFSRSRCIQLEQVLFLQRYFVGSMLGKSSPSHECITHFVKPLEESMKWSISSVG
jgi:polynucleotide 5'-kinase involved in rRNA processing